MENLDFLSDEKQELNEDKLKTLSELCYQQKVYEEKCNDLAKSAIISMITEKNNHISIETLEAVVKHYKKELDKISKEQIPAILNEIGLSELKLKTGEKITVTDKVKASIAKTRIQGVLKSMIVSEVENGMEEETAENMIKGLFKDMLKMETSGDLIKMLLSEEIPFEQDLSIHYQTLNKYCKDKLEQGQTIPEGISVFQYQETKIK